MMTSSADVATGRRRMPWRAIGWGIAGVPLLLPLIAMEFTDEVDWTIGDFLFAGLLIGAVGVTFELAVRSSRSIAYRAGVAMALAVAFLTIWANAAVGMVGDEDNRYNLFFLGVILVALSGAVAARFRAGGMAIAMAVAALAQLGLGIGGMFEDPRGGAFSALFGGLWLLSAASFRKAARDEAEARAPVGD